MKIITSNNTKLENFGKSVLQKNITKIDHPNIKIDYIIFDETREHSYFDIKKNIIILGIKDDWDKNCIIEMFLHELFHHYTQHWCKDNEKLCSVYLKYMKRNYKYRGWEFDDLYPNDAKKDNRVLDDFSDHVIVLYNIINIMTKNKLVTKSFFKSKKEMYRRFIIYLLKNYERVRDDLDMFGLIYKF